MLGGDQQSPLPAVVCNLDEQGGAFQTTLCTIHQEALKDERILGRNQGIHTPVSTLLLIRLTPFASEQLISALASSDPSSVVLSTHCLGPWIILAMVTGGAKNPHSSMVHVESAKLDQQEAEEV